MSNLKIHEKEWKENTYVCVCVCDWEWVWEKEREKERERGENKERKSKQIVKNVFINQTKCPIAT